MQLLVVRTVNFPNTPAHAATSMPNASSLNLKHCQLGRQSCRWLDSLDRLLPVSSDCLTLLSCSAPVEEAWRMCLTPLVAVSDATTHLCASPCPKGKFTISVGTSLRGPKSGGDSCWTKRPATPSFNLQGKAGPPPHAMAVLFRRPWPPGAAGY